MRGPQHLAWVALVYRPVGPASLAVWGKLPAWRAPLAGGKHEDQPQAPRGGTRERVMPGCLTCPRRYRHRYLDGWKERDTRAAMLFGRAFEQALGAYFRREDSGAVSAAADIETRAVRIRPDIVRRLTPLDMNIVFQRLELATDQGFDLIIGTNIFIYYDAFEQSLARANLATMLRPGGYLLSNDKFPIPFPLDWPAR
jgi:hypothetical protein